MKGILKDKLLIFSIFLIFYLLVEITTFLWVDFTFLPSDFLIDLVIAFALGSVIFLIKSRKWSIIYLSFFFFIVLSLFLINATMYKVYYDLFTLQQFALLDEAADVINFEHISILSIVISIGYTGLYIFTMKIACKKNKTKKISAKRYYPRALLGFACSMLFVFSFFMLGTERVTEFIENNNVTAFRRASLEKYGILGYYSKELNQLFEQDEDPDPDFGDDDQVDLSEPTPVEYHNLLEGKNVINILLESVQSFAINEVLTPNLYMLTDEGLYFENSFSENKTNVSELISIIGNYPSNPINPNTYDYNFDYSFPLLLRDEGYKTSYFHDNVDTFYSRGNFMPQLGFDNLYFHEELYPGQEIWSWVGDYTLDSVTMERMLPNFTSTDEPFYTYWASLSTHGPYNYGPENKLLFEELGYFSQIDQAEADGLWTNILADKEEDYVARIRHYQAAVMDLDKALGMMIDDLESKGILDDTVIVLFGDHNVYYHNIHLKIFEDTNNDISNMEMYRNFFCIYNPLLTETYLEKSGDDDSTISKFVTPYNIVPTLLDLFGYQYDTNLFLGTSIFSEEEDVFYSIKMTAFFNSNLFSTDGESIIYFREEYTDEELQDFSSKCSVIKEKIAYINTYYIFERVEKEE
ncbi:LTA synthase family protein [Mycoplasmatota bacterium WC30]